MLALKFGTNSDAYEIDMVGKPSRRRTTNEKDEAEARLAVCLANFVVK